MDEQRYLLDNQVAAAGERFAALAELFDPSTHRHLDQVGLTEGWRCWEVGAGGSALTTWLSARVGAIGKVVATDIDVAWAQEAQAPNVEVRRHDVAAEPPPSQGFDLVHARLVLVHVPQRDVALRSMVAALRPGGWLVVEDADPAMQPLSCPEARNDAERLANKLRTGFRALMAERGVDLAYGRTLPRLLREAGLDGVRADAYFPVAMPACNQLETGTIAHIRELLVTNDIATDAEIDEPLSNVAGGHLDLAQPPMITAWGRAPSQ